MNNIERTSQKMNTKAQGQGYCDKALAALCLEAASEGIVLLENDGILPLKKDAKVALFGRVQFDYIYVGYGSGGNVLAPYFINLVDALKQTDHVKLDENLLLEYQNYCKENAICPASEYQWGKWPYHYPEMKLDNALVQKASLENDLAIVVLGRAAGEDRESLLESGSYYLTDVEKDMLQKVTSSFKKTIVVLDTGNIIDFSWVNDYQISALVLAWQGGMEASRALANVLIGKSCASGKLTDTIATSYDKYPSSKNFGSLDYNNYEEDIYVGYRYFESFDKDSVKYPFGYGLTYTVFNTEVQSFKQDNLDINIKVKVSNIGSYEGKETLQVYVQCPQGLLGKSLRSLCAFKKTELLEPNQTQELDFLIDLRDCASYDDIRTYSFILEKGNYIFYLGSDVRSARKIGEIKLDENLIVEKLSQACAPEKKNVFKRIKAKIENSSNEVVLKPTFEDVPYNKGNRKEMILKAQEEEKLTSKTLTSSKGYTLIDVKNKKITMDEFVSQLSIEDLVNLCLGEGPMDSKLGVRGNAGAFAGYFENAKNLGIPTIITTDGPAGIRILSTTTLIPCGTALASTWNIDLVQKLTTLLGKELSDNSSDVLLAPGMNIHRNPLCGRNFEYYSEDPLVTGQMAAAFVLGVQKYGLSACPKHFACNNQETNRTCNDSRISERALREIYLKGFEICIKKAKPRNIMTSYNKINGVWSHYNYELVTKILRKEWSYEGCVMTDWWMQEAIDPDFNDSNDAYRVRAQVDVLMPGGWKGVTDNHDTSLIDSYKKGIITLGEIQRSAKNVLNFALLKL